MVAATAFFLAPDMDFLDYEVWLISVAGCTFSMGTLAISISSFIPSLTGSDIAIQRKCCIRSVLCN